MSHQSNPSFVLEVLTGPGADQELGELWSSAFPVPPGATFYDDFPVWSEKSNLPIRRFGLRMQGRLVAVAGIRMAEYSSPDGPIQVGLIGGVSTDEKYRGQGLASHLVEACCEWGAAQGAAFLALWGSEHSMYERLGFELRGQQIRALLKDVIAHTPRTVNVIYSGWSPALLPLLQRRSGGLVLNDSSASWISSHKNIQWRWSGTSTQPTAYLAYNRGIDLDGIVHEWGGNPKDLKQLMAQVVAENPEIQIISPPGLLEKYHLSVPQNVTVEYVCMVRVFRQAEMQKAFSHAPLWFWGIDGA